VEDLRAFLLGPYLSQVYTCHMAMDVRIGSGMSFARLPRTLSSTVNGAWRARLVCLPVLASLTYSTVGTTLRCRYAVSLQQGSDEAKAATAPSAAGEAALTAVRPRIVKPRRHDALTLCPSTDFVPTSGPVFVRCHPFALGLVVPSALHTH